MGFCFTVSVGMYQFMFVLNADRYVALKTSYFYSMSLLSITLGFFVYVEEINLTL